MTEREQVIEALEICAAGTNSCNKCPMKDKCKGVSNAAMVAAIKLLKDEEPAELIDDGVYFDFTNGPETTHRWICSACGRAVGYSKNKPNIRYCYLCGKKVEQE